VTRRALNKWRLCWTSQRLSCGSWLDLRKTILGIMNGDRRGRALRGGGDGGGCGRHCGSLSKFTLGKMTL
jgi:hypothetical protein